MDDNLVPFTTILAIEGTPTSDGRLLQLGGMSTRQVPLPIMAQMVNPEAGGHTGSVLVGKIENIESDGERVMGKGVIDTNTEYGKRVVDLLKSQTLRFVSIDIGAAEFEQDDSPEAVAPMVFTNYEVMGATIVPFPALPGAVIWLDGTDEPPEMTRFTPLFDKVRSLGFNPDQERDENGRWGSGSGKSYDWKDKIKLEIGEPEYKSKKHTETEEEIAYLLQQIEEGVPNEDGVMESLGDQGIHENENNIDELNKVIANFQAQEIIEPTRDAIVAEFKKYSDQIYVELDSSGASDSQYITVYPFSEKEALAAIDDIGTIEFLAPEQDIKIRISDHELPIGYADPGGDIVLFTKDMGGGGEAAMIGDFDPERVVEKVLTKFDVKPNSLTAAFSPDQERDENGKWTSGGGNGSEPVSALLDSIASGEKIEIRPDQVSIVLAEMAKKSNEGKDFNACEISVPGTNLFCEDHVGTERADMPQIKGTAREGSDAEKIADKHGKVDGTEAFRESLKASGIAIKDIDSVPVVSLKASQTELIGSKVGGMMKAIENGKIDLQDERIFVSKDGYILDGHHRWAAAIGVEAKDGKLNDNDITMNVTRVDANIKELIPLANEFAADFGIIPKPGA